MASNLLCLNGAKTEFLLLGHQSQLSRIHNPTLTLSNGISFFPTANARNLGFISDSNITFSHQISTVSRVCFYHVHDLRRIRSVRDFSITAHVIGTSLEHSRLD